MLLRHDVDFDLQSVIPMAEVELSAGVCSTFFLRLTTDYYNLLAPAGRRVVSFLREQGFQIGLHFDSGVYPQMSAPGVEVAVGQQSEMLAGIVGLPVRVVSFHRPPSEILGWSPSSFLNSYASEFMTERAKYLSDSGKHWREGCMCIHGYELSRGSDQRLQVLVHPEWWGADDAPLNTRIEKFLCRKTACLDSSLLEEITPYRQWKEMNPGIS